MFIVWYIIFSSDLVECSEIGTYKKAEGCEIDIRGLHADIPLLLKPSTNDILYPENVTVQLNTGDQIELVCPGLGKLKADDTEIEQIITAACKSGTEFEIKGKLVDLSKVACTKRLTSTSRYTNKKCMGKGKEIEVGFQLEEGRWLQLMTTCFEEVNRTALYSHFVLSKHINSQMTRGNRPSWAEGPFYNLTEKLDKLYTNGVQRSTINKQVGLSESDSKYVKESGNFYIARGHLAAKADFLYTGQQMQTFYYTNSAPQWQTFNGQNWFYLERCIRNYASNKRVNLEIYTGTYGISTLPHEKSKKDVELYLFVDENGNRAVPIPQLFWKIAYDPAKKAGVAVLGVNNPYQTDINNSIICNDIIDDLDWVTFDTCNIEAGFLYACTIDDLRKAIWDLPRLNVKSILK